MYTHIIRAVSARLTALCKTYQRRKIAQREETTMENSGGKYLQHIPLGTSKHKLNG